MLALRRVIVRTAMVSIILISGWYCNLPTPIGVEVVSDETLSVIYIDTLSLELSTVVFDSIETSNPQRLLVGFSNDPEFGSIRSRPFWRISADSIDELPSSRATFISGEFVLNYDDYSYFDTLQTQTVRIYTVDEELDKLIYYNINSFDFGANGDIGHLTFAPRPVSEEQISVPISDDFAFPIFEDMVEEGEDFRRRPIDFVPPFVVELDSSQHGLFLGFSLQSAFVINYREDAEDKTVALVPDIAFRYNQILGDRSGSEITQLVDQKNALPASSTSGQAYMQGGTGLGIRVSIPHIDLLKEVLARNFVARAVLRLEPVPGSFDDDTPLPTNFSFTRVDKFNRFQEFYRISGDLVIDDEFKEDTFYEFDILPFIDNQFLRQDQNEDGILITLNNDDLPVAVDRLVARYGSKFQTKIELYILNYEN